MGNCLEGCIRDINNFKNKNTRFTCPKCKRKKWLGKKTKEEFMKHGCIMCTMRDKYMFKPIKKSNEDMEKYKATGRYYSNNGEVTIEEIEVFAVDSKNTKRNLKLGGNNYHIFN